MIRIPATLLTFLIATGVAAQVVSPIEQSYGPYTRGFDRFEPALAVSRDAVLLAWSEIVAPRKEPQIRFGLLDFHGRLVSPITTIETDGRTSAPNVTTDGESFRVEYIEDDFNFAVNVDARGALVGSPFRAARTKPNPLSAQWVAPICFRPCLNLIPYKTLQWTYLGRRGSHFQGKTEEVGPVVGGGIPDHFVLAWSTHHGIWYVEYLDGVKTFADGGLIPVSVHSKDRIAIGCDDTHCLLTFTTPAQQIYGVLIDPAQPHLAVPVPIETATRVERPQVHVLKPGRFLVVYMSPDEDPHQHRFAGRIVTTAPQPRRRAVR